MPDRNRKINTIALQSSLFKGRSDWYFCYLKAEKIAHVTIVLAERVPHDTGFLKNLAHKATDLPSTLVHFAAGEIDKALVLADLFSLISGMRLAGTQHLLSPENVAILVQELEQVAERIASENHPSPFVSAEDFSVPPLVEAATAPLLISKTISTSIKDISKGQLDKGQNKGHQASEEKRQNDRPVLILNFIRSSSRPVSIKDISKVVGGFSEKTIQRELGVLIGQGLIRKEGERRWSVYRPA